jgi:hypothetical protein
MQGVDNGNLRRNVWLRVDHLLSTLKVLAAGPSLQSRGSRDGERKQAPGGGFYGNYSVVSTHVRFNLTWVEK